MLRSIGFVATALVLAQAAAAQNLGEAAIREQARRQAIRAARTTAPPEAPRPCPSPRPGVNAVPRLFQEARPTFPSGPLSEGKVELDALIGTDGSILEVQQTRSSGNVGLDGWARAIVMKRTYCPALKDGVPVKAWDSIRIWFAPAGPDPEAPRPRSL